MNAADTKTRILEAATTLFLDQGYGSTSLDQIAAAAGVTKPTVYSHFGSKQGLLEAMTTRYTDIRVDEFRDNLLSGGPPREALTRFADAFLGRVMSEESRAWQRLATAESKTYPEVGEAFFAAGPQRVFQCLTEYLRQEKHAGRLRIESPQRAAERFLGMLIGLDLFRSLIGRPLPAASTLKRRSGEVVQAFLSAHAIDNATADNATADDANANGSSNRSAGASG